MVSVLSRHIKRAGDQLLSGATDQISDYKSRFGTMKGVYENALRNLIVSQFNAGMAYATAEDFFGGDSTRFGAVDGTEYVRPLFDLIIFYGGSFASTGQLVFRRDGLPEVEYDRELLARSKGLSSCVPVYANEIPDIDVGLDQVRGFDDKALLDNSKIADWIMVFSEFYLAYKLIVEDSVRILLMDRSLSGEHSALIRDTSKRRWAERNCKLNGMVVAGQEVSAKQLFYGRARFLNSDLDLPPPRGDWLRLRALYELEDGSLTLDEICDRLRIQDAGRRGRLERQLAEMVNAGFCTGGPRFQLAQELVGCWEKLKALTTTIGDGLFLAERRGNPLKVDRNGREEYLTTMDIAFLTLYTFYMIVEEAWRRKVLLIGLTKDTAARDFRRQVISVCTNEGIFASKIDPRELDRIPNTDRMLLQATSLYNNEEVRPPWSLIEYDAAFKTIVPYLNEGGRGGGKGYVSGAVQNRISPERLFLKSYIQLAQAEHDPKLRSNVLLMDRLVYAEYDCRPEAQVRFTHHYGGADEVVEPIIYRDNSVQNPVQNLVMTVLCSMTSPSIPEAFGHNVPLFVADNAAKWQYGQIRRIIDSTGQWILSNHDLRSFVFYMNTFREKRAGFEMTRRQPDLS